MPYCIYYSKCICRLTGFSGIITTPHSLPLPLEVSSVPCREGTWVCVCVPLCTWTHFLCLSLRLHLLYLTLSLSPSLSCSLSLTLSPPSLSLPLSETKEQTNTHAYIQREVYIYNANLERETVRAGFYFKKNKKYLKERRKETFKGRSGDESNYWANFERNQSAIVVWWKLTRK